MIHFHCDTPRKWQPVVPPSSPPPPSSSSSTQPASARSLTEEQGRKLASIIYSLVEAGVAVSTALVCGIVGEECRVQVSLSWARSFLRDLGLSYKASARSSTPPTVQQAREAQHLLKLKVIHSMVEHGAGWDQVYNIDETACHLLPTPQRAWTVKGRDAKAKWIMDKQVVTAHTGVQP